MAINTDPVSLNILAGTIAKYTKGASDETIRRRLLLAMMQKYGSITYGNGGTSMVWQVEYKQPQLRTAGDATERVYEANISHKQLTLPWRGYYETDVLSEMQQLQNRGNEALVNYYTEKSKMLLKSMTNGFSRELYNDGEANTSQIHGLESIYGSSTTAAADKFAKPGDTYGGLSTAVGAYGGTWTSDLSPSPNASIATDWPYGSGDSHYDFLAPKMGNSSSTAWNGSGITAWVDNCSAVLRETTLALNTTTNDNSPLVGMMGPDLMAGVKTFFDAKVRINVQHQESQDLGFGDTLNFEGVALHSEFGVPGGAVYLCRIGEMELACMYDSLFYPTGPHQDFQSKNILFSIGFFGNMKLRPRHFGKIKAYA